MVVFLVCYEENIVVDGQNTKRNGVASVHETEHGAAQAVDALSKLDPNTEYHTEWRELKK